MNKAFPELSQALSELLDQMDASIKRGGYDGPPITMFLAGGMAVNYYCGTRYTEDVDAFYTRRVHVVSGVTLNQPRRVGGQFKTSHFE
jgi:hypothetical protein